MIDHDFQEHPDDRYGIQRRKDDDLVREDNHGSPGSRLTLGLPDQIRGAMEYPGRPVQECPQLDPPAVETPLRRVHALAI